MADIALDIESGAVAPTNQSVDSVTDWLRVTGKIASGCTASFELYYKHFFDLMFEEACRVISADEHACLDVVQDAMIKTIRSMKPIADKAKLDAWSRTVVRSVAYDRLRKQIRIQLLHAQARDFVFQETDRLLLEETATKLNWLETQLQGVDPELRQMMGLRYRFGWTLKKIANHFGIKTGAVDGRLRRLMQQLKKRAESEFNEDD